jgi:hypothetical protein
MSSRGRFWTRPLRSLRSVQRGLAPRDMCVFSRLGPSALRQIPRSAGTVRAMLSLGWQLDALPRRSFSCRKSHVGDDLVVRIQRTCSYQTKPISPRRFLPNEANFAIAFLPNEPNLACISAEKQSNLPEYPSEPNPIEGALFYQTKPICVCASCAQIVLEVCVPPGGSTLVGYVLSRHSAPSAEYLRWHRLSSVAFSFQKRTDGIQFHGESASRA